MYMQTQQCVLTCACRHAAVCAHMCLQTHSRVCSHMCMQTAVCAHMCVQRLSRVCSHPGTHTLVTVCPFKKVWLQAWKDSSEDRGFEWCWGSPRPRVWGAGTQDAGNHRSGRGRGPHLCCSLSSEGSGLQARRGDKASFPSPAAITPTRLSKVSCLLALSTCGLCKSPQDRRELCPHRAQEASVSKCGPGLCF